MPPIVSVIGKSKSGKTTLIEKFVQELKSRGYRMATIKHIPRGVSFDEPGKDSWRHKLTAIVTDEPLETKARQFSFEDINGLADLLEKGFIKPQKDRVSLYVNNMPVALTMFPRQIIGNVLLAMASCLKGVKQIRNMQIFLRRG